MTKKFQIILSGLMILLFAAPVVGIIVMNIIYPEPEKMPVFRALSVIFILVNFILIPYLSFITNDGEESGFYTCCFIFVIAAWICLISGAPWRNFWGYLSRPAHKDWSNFGFYLAFCLTWGYNAIMLALVLIDTDFFEETAKSIAMRIAERTPFKSQLRGLAEKDSDSEVRKTAIEKLDKESDLEHILTWGKYADTRVMAAEKVNNPALLTVLAENDESYHVRAAAVKHVTDQDVLVRIAENDKSFTVREQAVNRLDDRAVLERIVLSEDKENVRMAAVRRLNDSPNVLKELALHDKDASIRAMAAQKIEEPAVLNEIILSETDTANRKKIIGRVKDPEILLQIVQKDGCIDIRKMAIEKIESAEDLKRIAQENDSPEIRRLAVQKLNDTAVLRKIALNDCDPKVREEAVNGMAKMNTAAVTDTLASIAVTDESEFVRKAAVESINIGDLEKSVLKAKAETLYFPEAHLKEISNEDVIRILARKANDPQVRKAAFERIDDREFLESIVFSEPLSLNRDAILARIHDEKVIRKVIETDPDEAVVSNAIRRINDTELLVKIAQKEKSRCRILETILEMTDDPRAVDHIAEHAGEEKTRLKAVEKTGNQDVLIRIVKNDKSTSVRLAAIKKIDDEAVLRRIIFHDNDMMVVREAVSCTKDTSAKILGLERLLKNDEHDSAAAARLRDLYQRNRIDRRISERHYDVHEEGEPQYCCYDDYTDHSDTSYYSESL